jgi:hypothetical protein
VARFPGVSPFKLRVEWTLFPQEGVILMFEDRSILS